MNHQMVFVNVKTVCMVVNLENMKILDVTQDAAVNRNNDEKDWTDATSWDETS